MSVPHSAAVDGSDGIHSPATGGSGSLETVLLPPLQAVSNNVKTASARDIPVMLAFAPPAWRFIESVMVISLSRI
jgi:hypothetical protein